MFDRIKFNKWLNIKSYSNTKELTIVFDPKM